MMTRTFGFALTTCFEWCIWLKLSSCKVKFSGASNLSRKRAHYRSLSSLKEPKLQNIQAKNSFLGESHPTFDSSPESSFRPPEKLIKQSIVFQFPSNAVQKWWFSLLVFLLLVLSGASDVKICLQYEGTTRPFSQIVMQFPTEQPNVSWG